MTTDTRQEDEQGTTTSPPTAMTHGTKAGDDMTAPTPDQYRVLADRIEGHHSWNDEAEVADALRTAADKLDRVSSELAKSNINAGLRIEELRNVIENAPHDRDESCGFGVDPRDMSNCTCWKADAL